MTKAIQAVLAGLLFGFILDYFFFLGIFLNYIKKLDIDVYFNIFFWDAQNIFIYLTLSLFVGFVIMYLQIRLKLIIMITLFLVSFSSLIENIGYMYGKTLFMKEDVVLTNKKFKFVGDIYYIGRKKITFFDKELNKVILLDKSEIVSELYK